MSQSHTDHSDVKRHCRTLFVQRLGVEFDRVRLQDLAHIKPDEQQMMYLRDNLRVFLSASDQKILEKAKPDSKAVEELLADVCEVLEDVENDLKVKLERLSLDPKKNPEKPVYTEFQYFMRPHMRMVTRTEHADKFKEFREKKTGTRKANEERVVSEKRVKKVEGALIGYKIAEKAVEDRAAICDQMEANYRDFLDGKSSIETARFKVPAHVQQSETWKSILRKCRPLPE